MEVVYTDGACLDDGQQNARAAFGVFWGNNDKRNVSVLALEDYLKQMDMLSLAL